MNKFIISVVKRKEPEIQNTDARAFLGKPTLDWGNPT